jgi:hypothetical protein
MSSGCDLDDHCVLAHPLQVAKIWFTARHEVQVISQGRYVAFVLLMTIASVACTPMPASTVDTPTSTSASSQGSATPLDSSSEAATTTPSLAATPLAEATANETSSPDPDSNVSPNPVPTGYSVIVPAGLHPKWTADAAVDRVIQFERVTRIISVTAMRGRDLPGSLDGPEADVSIVWVVHALGSFVNPHGYTQSIFTEGWFMFDDSNGFGFGEALVGTVTPLNPTPSPRAS